MCIRDRNKEQPRKTFDEGALQELADSIVQHGVLQPLLVRPLASDVYKRQLQGSLSDKISNILDKIVSLSASMAAWVDYPDEEIPELDESTLKSTLTLSLIHIYNHRNSFCQIIAP